MGDEGTAQKMSSRAGNTLHWTTPLTRSPFPLHSSSGKALKPPLEVLYFLSPFSVFYRVQQGGRKEGKLNASPSHGGPHGRGSGACSRGRVTHLRPDVQGSKNAQKRREGCRRRKGGDSLFEHPTLTDLPTPYTYDRRLSRRWGSGRRGTK